MLRNSNPRHVNQFARNEAPMTICYTARAVISHRNCDGDIGGGVGGEG